MYNHNTKGGSIMNLPRNIVQIGEPDKYDKIYIEDYVLTYLKQNIKKNKDALNFYGQMQTKIVLFGKEQKENDITYYFLFAAASLKSVSEQNTYLSQAEREEAQGLCSSFFENYQIKAYCVLGEELPDGFYLLNGLKGKFVKGYSCFYEQNDSMLSFMLLNKEQTESSIRKKVQVEKPETRSRKYEPKIEQSRELIEEKKSHIFSGLRAASVWVLIVFCILGITGINDAKKIQNWKMVFQKGLESLEEKKIPDKGNIILEDTAEQVNAQKIVLKDIDLQPNIIEEKESNENTECSEKPENIEITQKVDSPSVVEQEKENKESDNENEKQVVSYTVQRGDTLLSISRERYGTMKRVKEICDLNQITNPDSIQIGQTILLPE